MKKKKNYNDNSNNNIDNKERYRKEIKKGNKISPKSLNHYRTIPHFDAYRYVAVEKHCEKRRNCNKQFLLFSQNLLPYMALIFHFKCILMI